MIPRLALISSVGYQVCLGVEAQEGWGWVGWLKNPFFVGQLLCVLPVKKSMLVELYHHGINGCPS